MASLGYKILQQQVSDPDMDELRSQSLQSRSHSSKLRFGGLTLLLFTSLSFNAISLYHQLRAYSDGSAESATVYGYKAFFSEKSTMALMIRCSRAVEKHSCTFHHRHGLHIQKSNNCK